MTLSRLTFYYCSSCNTWCLEDIREPIVRYRECEDCFQIPALDREPIDEIHPSLSWALCLDLDFPAFSPASPSAGGTRIRERAESPSRSDHREREYGVSCASERFPIETDGGDRA
jgi:hypothetical protein